MQDLKNRISSPFDFQHLTHTNRHHFAALEEATENELVAGFRAVRASQAPRRNLTGIKAQDIHSSNGSEEDLGGTERRSLSAMELRPPPDFVDHVVESPDPAASPESSTRPSLRQSRSVESFSRPGVTARTHRHTQSANPPPRGSSRLPVGGHDHTQDSTTVRANRLSGVWDNAAPLSPSRMGGLLPSMAEEPDYVGHALTTPDNSAIHPMTPPFSPGLEDVAEEPERFVSPRPAPLPPNKSPRSPRSPSHATFSFSQRSPTTKSHARRDSHVLPTQFNAQNIMRPTAQVPEPLVSPALSRRCSIRKPPSARRASNTWRVIEESWEDDIDYIYDNALEAECELDWDENDEAQQAHRESNAVPSTCSAKSSPMVEGEPSLSPCGFTGNFRASLLVPSMSNIPELEPRSAISSSATSVQTPSDFAYPQGPFGEAGRFSFTPSLLGSAEGKEQMPREDIYDNLLADYEGSDKHFPLLEPTRSVASSTRSSHVRTSKCSSYDSSLMSSGHASGSWTANIRRSGSSAGSLPELVHSTRPPRQDLSTAVNKLSEEMDSFTTQDENDLEDDDVTPPGHGAQGRTFFASDDDQEPTGFTQTALNAEMKTSLELARQGSNGASSRARTYHKYASSDGAAKLLDTNSTSSRNRAGSVPQKGRGQYLSLFPSPPKH